MVYGVRGKNSRVRYNKKLENIGICTNCNRIDKNPANAVAGSTKKNIVVLCIPFALFSTLRVLQNT